MNFSLSANMAGFCSDSHNYIIACAHDIFTEVSYHGMWAVLDEIQEPELKNLARKLPETLLHSRADAMYTQKVPGSFS